MSPHLSLLIAAAGVLPVFAMVCWMQLELLRADIELRELLAGVRR